MANQAFEAGDIIRMKLIVGSKIEAEFVSNTADQIIVKNTKNLKTGKVREKTQMFYWSEIKRIGSLCANATVNDDKSVQNDSNNSSLFDTCNFIPKKTFTDREVEKIQVLTQNTAHITQFDDKYHNALSDIMKQDIVFVNYESMFGRLNPKRSVLTIATSSNVYMFDMLRLGSMKKEMKLIFTEEWPQKVIHSTAEFADYLQHKEHCSLNGAFDTLMVHFNLKKTNQHITVQKCFEHYFELPDDFVLQKQNFDIRPLASEAMIRAALTSIMLMKLYWRMNDILMKPLQKATDKFGESYKCGEPYKRVENPVDLIVNDSADAQPGEDLIELKAVEQLEEAFNHSVGLLIDI